MGRGRLCPPRAAWAHTGAQDPVHRGPGSGLWRLGLLPAGDLDISAKRSVFTQKGRGARRGISTQPDPWFALMSVPSGSPAPRLLSVLYVYCPWYRPETKCVLCNVVSGQDGSGKNWLIKTVNFMASYCLIFKLFFPIRKYRE